MFIGDDVVLNKSAVIERCVQRARDEYEVDPETFAANFSRQDAAILNIQRSCQAALDMGQYLIRREGLGIPQGARDVFAILAQAGWIAAPLAHSLQRMVSYRNIAVHDYQTLQLPITIAIIVKHLDDFKEYCRQILQAESGNGNP